MKKLKPLPLTPVSTVMIYCPDPLYDDDSRRPWELYQTALGTDIKYYAYFYKMSHRIGTVTWANICELNLN